MPGLTMCNVCFMMIRALTLLIGLTGPTSIVFSPKSPTMPTYLAFLSSNSRLRLRNGERQFCVVDTNNLNHVQPLINIENNTPFTAPDSGDESLEEKLRRERQRLHSTGSGVTQFSWVLNCRQQLSILVPSKGSLYVQDGIAGNLTLVYDKATLQSTLSPMTTLGSVVGRDAGAIDAQLSPDGRLVAFVVAGEIYVLPCRGGRAPIRISYGAVQDGTNSITHGLADFVAQEEMDRYRGFWWHPEGIGILFARVDESQVPPYRIHHQGNGEDMFEDHRYPFCGQKNPTVQLGFVRIDPLSILDLCAMQDAQEVARERWGNVIWFPPPREAQEYLARVSWFPDGSACAQWQNRTQTTLVLTKLDMITGKSRTLLVERSDVWINLHHMLRVLPRAIHPDECADAVETIVPPGPLPNGSFSFLFASERTGFMHLYLYTYAPGINSERAILIRAVSAGDWMVESVVGVDMDADAVYITGTYDSSLERHLYALPIIASASTEDNGCDQSSGGMRRSLKNVMSALSGTKSVPSNVRDSPDGIMPIRLTTERGMHSIVMDDECRYFVDSSSDLGRPTTVKVYKLPEGGPFSLSNPSTSRGRKMSRKLVDEEDVRLLYTLYDAANDDKSMNSLLGNLNEISGERLSQLPAPELLSFPTSDGTATLHAALYRPDARIHGPGPHPLICAVYGGPHVQRVNRSWSQCCDMRAQRLRSLGFAVVKCDNRGSSRRGLAFEGAIRRRLGRLEVLDQVAAVRHLAQCGIADSSRIGVYGWSYGGYLAAMCLCRAPDVFHAAVAGAPVTSWDGYDTHYTERYMGLPSDNSSGYRESAVFDHVPNMRGKLMIVHGLIDENVHFRHSARLINRLIANGKDYDLLIFPDERHSPRRLRDRIYMEQRISDFFSAHLGPTRATPPAPVRNVAGHL
jgi:dipeptidyl-peptidase-4